MLLQTIQKRRLFAEIWWAVESEKFVELNCRTSASRRTLTSCTTSWATKDGNWTWFTAAWLKSPTSQSLVRGTWHSASSPSELRRHRRRLNRPRSLLNRKNRHPSRRPHRFILLHLHDQAGSTSTCQASSRVPTPPGKYWIFSWKFQDLESPGKSLWSWKVLEI